MSNLVNKKLVEEHLDNIDYTFKNYMPSIEAIKFTNFIKELNGEEGEENETPLVHLAMMDSVFNTHPRNAILCHRGISKLGSPKSKVLLSSGWSTMEKVKVGDQVITRDGTTAAISHKTDFQMPDMYEIELSDGTKYEVGDEHLNIVWMYRKQSREKVLTTLELLSRPLYTMNKSRANKRNPKKSYTYSIPLVQPIEFTHKLLPIEPYVFGYGLANGYFKKSQISCHADDYLEISKSFDSKGYSQSSSKYTSENGIQFKLKGHIFKLYSDLKSRTKYIPEEYLFGSIEQRAELLRGLMDGDGHIAKNGSCAYSSYSFSLAHSVKELVQSLGGISYVKKYGDCYRTIVNIKINPFKLKRKSSRWKPTKKTSRAIVNIKPIAKTGGYCIYVNDDTHSYLTDGYTVTHNTTLFGEYLTLWKGAFNNIPGFGKTNLSLYISDSIENGVKNLRRNVEYRFQNSDYIKYLIPSKRLTLGTDTGKRIELEFYEEALNDGGYKFTDIRLEFENRKGGRHITKSYGILCLALDEKVYLDDKTIEIKDVQIGNKILCPDGTFSNVINKSIIHTTKPMYKLVFKDGRELKVTHDHINPLFDRHAKKKVLLTVDELLKRKLKSVKDQKYYFHTIGVESLEYSKKNLPMDPYTLGIILGDGHIGKKGSGVRLGMNSSDLNEIISYIPYDTGIKETYLTKNKKEVTYINILDITRNLNMLSLRGVTSLNKFIPDVFLLGSKEQRIELIRGLMDTDGCIINGGYISFSSISKTMIYQLAEIVRSLGGEVNKITEYKNRDNSYGKNTLYRLSFKININPFKLKRKSDKFIPYTKLSKNALVSIEPIPLEPSVCIEIDHPEHEFVTTGMLATHNTGIKGTKELGQRPIDAVFDDIIKGDDAARSAIVIQTVKNSIYKDVAKALHPKNKKMIYLGTPYNQNDPLYQAIESGVWTASVYPICEYFDGTTTREEFIGSWEDRFGYDYVKDEYDTAVAVGEPQSFYQELMLRVTNKDDLLIQDSDIRYYESVDLIHGAKQNFNFYITTDFAVTAKESADNSVISVWALDDENNIYWVTGFMEKCTIDKSIDRLFQLVEYYNPMQTGVETSGQQGAIITMIEQQMMRTGIIFTLGSDRNKKAKGFHSSMDKIARLNTVVPYFKIGRIYFPKDKLNDKILVDGLAELKSASSKGFATIHDDFADTVSMLSRLTFIKPSIQKPKKMKVSSNTLTRAEDESGIDDIFNQEDSTGGYSDYIN